MVCLHSSNYFTASVGVDETLSRCSNVNGTPSGIVSPSMILAYHIIEPEQASYLYSVTWGQLEEHLRLVGELRAAAQSLAGAPQVTFDDGHISNYRYALPLLERHRVPAIFFVTPSLSSAKAEYYMTWAQLREIVSLGHEVQSHGWSHCLLTHCSKLELREELVRSKQTLEDKLGVAVVAISMPGGRWNRRVLEVCAYAGYRRVYVSAPWVGPVERKGVTLRGRLMVRRTMKTEQLSRLLYMDRWSLLRMRGEHVVTDTVRYLIGDHLYLYLWRILAKHPGA